MPYSTPVADIRHALAAAGLDEMIAAGLLPDLSEDLLDAILEEGGKFATDVIAPLNRVGDVEGLTLEDGAVTTPKGWIEAYRQYVEAGWGGVTAEAEHGGQGLPTMLGMALSEMWNGASVAFGLCPVLTAGAVEALEAHGSEALKATYLEKLVSGEWTGTMNLTEPQAGSDLSALRTRAVPQDDGSYKITGSKIYITYGEHDMAENICHLVLARLPDAPAGTRGISLFLVPKFLVGEDGSLGARNDLRCSGLEHKLGIHASPTCTMVFGDQGGAIGWLIGEENKGLRCMFTMMNNARLQVGVQGVGVADRATQGAMDYAVERRQGRADGRRDGEMSAIVEHPDVKRTLLTMRAYTAASRAICFACAEALDRAALGADEAEKAAASLRANILTPVAKAFSTDIGVDVAGMGVQVHGGMGFVEETGAAQHLRDARILPIYEGTNGIQAIDLVTRKLPLENGDAVRTLIADYRTIAEELRGSNREAFGRSAKRLGDALDALEGATEWMLEALSRNPNEALATATPYLRLFGLASGGAYLAREALRAGADGKDDVRARTLRHFAEMHLAETSGLLDIVTDGGTVVLETDHIRLAS
ncbi:MAG: acyl-CoA dehydrogenase [Pseudomonadota bacterium]